MTALFTKLPSTATITPSSFRVAIPDEQLSDLKTLLRLSRTAPQTYENLQEDRRYGVTHEWMSTMKEEWLNNFDWRAVEEHANSFPQYTTEIEGLIIHFAALFSEKADAVPIVLLHGWPGSYFEFLPLLQLFKDEYSPRILKNADSARIVDQLMKGLGFSSGYVSQGGDIGSSVARILAVGYDSCKVNFCPLVKRPEGVSDEYHNELEKRGFERSNWFLTYGKAYAEEHGTKPATIGHVLASSPLALLAWVGEKYLDWPDTPFSKHKILELVTLYWFTESFPRAIYPYRQNIRTNPIPPGPSPFLNELYIHKPLGFSYFPKELIPVPESWVAKTGNLVYFKQHSEGGHFAALELPNKFKEDLTEFVAQVWSGVSK
ncbi:Alpha/Beta hydrolase protein [Aspergillus spinulosporus]